VPRMVSLLGGAIAIAGVIVVNLWGKRPLLSRNLTN